MLENKARFKETQSRIPLARVVNYEPKMVDRHIVNEIKPFIFSNNLQNWPALKLWTPMFFKQNYGDLEFNVNPNLPSETAPYLFNAKPHHKLMKLSELIDLMSKNNSCYLAQEDMQAFKDLKEHYNFTELVPSHIQGKNILTNIWIGSNTRSGLHFDNVDNFLAQIYGTKNVILISPNDISFVYPIPSNFHKSPINPFEPDIKAFPNFKKAKIFEGVLNPGDVLFIPRGWYHYIYSPQQSISLNCWYGSPLTSKDFLLAFYRSGWKSWVTCLKDFIWHGILFRSFEDKLYSGAPLGKVMYDFIKMKIRRLFCGDTM